MIKIILNYFIYLLSKQIWNYIDPKVRVKRFVKMATSAKTPFSHYQNGKYGTLPGNPGNNSEVTQDMHLKMSKKIAQLTKVSVTSVMFDKVTVTVRDRVT